MISLTIFILVIITIIIVSMVHRLYYVDKMDMNLTWEQLALILNHASYTEEGKKWLKMPVVITDKETQKKFLIGENFQIVRDMGNLPVINVSYKP